MQTTLVEDNTIRLESGVKSSMIFYCDNKATINITYNPVQYD